MTAAHLTAARMAALILRFRAGEVRRSPARALALLAGLAWVALNAAGLVFLLDAVPDFADSRGVMLQVANLTVAAFFFLVAVFPNYRPPTAAVPAFYPLGSGTRALFGLLCDLLQPRPLFAVAFFLVLLASAHYGAVALAVSLLALGGVFLVERSLRLVVAHTLPGRAAHALAASTLGALLGFALWNQSYQAPLLLLALLLAGAQHVWLARAAADAEWTEPVRHERSRRGARTAGARSVEAVAVHLLLRTRKLYTPLLVGLGFKVFTLLLFSRMAARDDTPAGWDWIVWVIAGPLPIFTYAINNTFGHLVAFWDTLLLHAPSPRAVVRSYLAILALPAALDALISFTAAAAMGMLNVRFVSYYAAVLAVLAVVGYAGSLLFARPVSARAMLSLRSNTSVLVSVGITGPVATLYALSAPTRMFPVAAGVGIALAAAALFGIHRKFARVAPRTYAAVGQ